MLKSEQFDDIHVIMKKNKVLKSLSAVAMTATALVPSVGTPIMAQDQELEPEKSFIYSISNLMKMTSDFESRIKKMKSTFLSPEVEDRQKLLGSMIEKSLLYEYSNQAGKVKLSPAMVVKAYENVYMNTDSPYYVKDTEECSVFNYYNAFTELIKDATKKDLMTGYEKTLLVGQLFDLVA